VEGLNDEHRIRSCSSMVLTCFSCFSAENKKFLDYTYIFAGLFVVTLFFKNGGL
jgi:hypothetical protein